MIYILKTFARSESDCTLRLGLSSLIKNISNTRQSNLLLHFFKMLKLLLRSLGAEECFESAGRWMNLRFCVAQSPGVTAIYGLYRYVPL